MEARIPKSLQFPTLHHAIIMMFSFTFYSNCIMTEHNNFFDKNVRAHFLLVLIQVHNLSHFCRKK